MMNLNKIIMGVLLVIVACLGGYIYFDAPKTTPITSSKRSEIVTEAKILARKTDRKGIQHTILEETNNILPANLVDEGYSSEFVDSLLMETDIQRDEIKALTRINQTIQQDNLKAVQVISTLQEKVYSYTDDNVILSFKTDSVNVNGLFGYAINQNLDIREYSRKKWLLGRQREMMDITSTSKFSTINNVNKVTIEKKEDPFDIEATSKVSYLPKSGNAGFGGQLRIRYKNLSLTGSNLYFPTENKWINVVGAEYRLLKF